MKTKTAVILTIFICCLLNVITFRLEGIPEGCYTVGAIVTGAWLVFDWFMDRNNK